MLAKKRHYILAWCLALCCNATEVPWRISHAAQTGQLASSQHSLPWPDPEDCTVTCLNCRDSDYLAVDYNKLSIATREELLVDLQGVIHCSKSQTLPFEIHQLSPER